MNVKQWLRRQITAILASRGYALSRITVSGTGWEPALKAALSHDAERRSLVLDIGANEGGFSRMVLEKDPRAEIFAFEPLPEMIQKLETIPAGRHKLVILPFALGAEVRQAEFNVHTQPDSSSLLGAHPDYRSLYPAHATVAKSIEIRVETLDGWAAENGLIAGRQVDLVKMDVQGYEAQVIAGGREVLRSTHFLIVEAALYPLYEGGVMIDELCASLRALGFELVWGFNVCGAFCDLFWKNTALLER